MRSYKLLFLNSIGVLIVTLVAIIVWNQLLIDFYLCSIWMEVFLWDLIFSVLSFIILCMIDILLIYHWVICVIKEIKNLKEKKNL